MLLHRVIRDMPTITFTINQNKFDQATEAISIYNASHQSSPVTGESDLAKALFLEDLKTYRDIIKNIRISSVNDLLQNCSPATWNQVYSILTGNP